MVMEREVIADVGVWTAKKRYMLNVHNSEGVQYDEPKMKIMGIETTLIDTTSRSTKVEGRDQVGGLTEDQVINFVANFKEVQGYSPDEIAFPVVAIILITTSMKPSSIANSPRLL